jgi:hypothetical protein
MHRYIISLFALAAIFLGLFAWFNAAVDPSNLFGSDELEREVSKALLKGESVANLRNYDERMLQKYYVQGLGSAPDVIIIGSSRSLQLREISFDGKRVFNSGVSGASLEDYMAIWQLYLANQITPDYLVLGIDPWIFNRKNTQVRWKSLAQEFNDISLSLGLDVEQHADISVSKSKLQTIFSLAYLKESIRVFFAINKTLNPTEYFITDVLDHPLGVKLDDGSVVSPLNRRDPDQHLVSADAARFASAGSAYSMEGYWRIDPVLRNSFEVFLDALGSSDIKVIILLPPYHPLAYDGMIQNGYAIVGAVEEYIRDAAQRRGMVLTGSYDPRSVGCDITEFTDGMHPKEACIKRLIEPFEELAVRSEKNSEK